MANEKPINVGIAGLGRAGWGLHVATLKMPAIAEKFHVVAVTDPITARMDEAEALFGCRKHASYDELITDPNVELVVVATLNNQHAPQSIAAMRAGKHVLSEKPMATSLADAEAMVRVSKETGRILTIDHCMRFNPAFQKVRDILQSGILGEIILIRLTSQCFRRRWDWQTLKEFGGGEMNNNASHCVDEALALLGGSVMPKVTSDLRRTPLCAGDAEDHVKISLQAKGYPTVDIEVTNSCAYPQDHFFIMGTKGGLTGNHQQIRWRFFDPALLPTRIPDPAPTPDRSYGSEELPWREETWARAGEHSGGYDFLYLNLFDAIRFGKPLGVTPESVRNVVAVLEECRRQNAI